MSTAIMHALEEAKWQKQWRNSRTKEEKQPKQSCSDMKENDGKVGGVMHKQAVGTEGVISVVLQCGSTHRGRDETLPEQASSF